MLIGLRKESGWYKGFKRIMVRIQFHIKDLVGILEGEYFEKP